MFRYTFWCKWETCLDTLLLKSKNDALCVVDTVAENTTLRSLTVNLLGKETSRRASQ